jgi:hypothetical protein
MLKFQTMCNNINIQLITCRDIFVSAHVQINIFGHNIDVTKYFLNFFYFTWMCLTILICDCVYERFSLMPRLRGTTWLGTNPNKNIWAHTQNHEKIKIK